MASHSDRVTISAIRTNRRPLQEGARDRYVSCLCSFRLGSADNDEMVDVNDANEPSDLIYGHLAMQLGGRILRSKTYRAFDLLLKFRKTLSIEKDPKVPAEQIARKYLVYEGNAILLKTFEHVLTSRGDVVDTMKDLNDLVQLASSVDLRKVYECFIVDDNEVGGAMVEAVRAIEATSGTERLPVLLSVPHYGSGEQRRVGRGDIDDYVMKPCSGEAILKRIRSLSINSNAQLAPSGRQN
jgi:CheY-like chemotaxis protein